MPTIGRRCDEKNKLWRGGEKAGVPVCLWNRKESNVVAEGRVGEGGTGDEIRQVIRVDSRVLFALIRILSFILGEMETPCRIFYKDSMCCFVEVDVEGQR